ncbi:MAG: sensor histidine kinase [Candidatus Kapabacteria bacterium]|jgi:signal transduction histidine kinase|nr:sensor histidine kinase [Candidatus Kapabacteria bacterium]
MRGDAKKSFRPSSSAPINIPQTNGALWVRFHILPRPNPAGQTGEYFLTMLNNTPLDTVEIYQVSNNGTVERFSRRGNLVKSEQNDISLSRIAFRLAQCVACTPDKPQAVYLRVTGKFNLLFGLAVGDDNALLGEIHRDDVLNCAYFGVMLAMIAYNFFLISVLRNKMQVYYLFYVSAALGMNLFISGYGYHFLWSAYPRFNDFAPMFTASVGLFSLLFTIEFLSLRTRSPRLHRVMQILCGNFVLGIGLIAIGSRWSYYTLQVGAVMSPFLIVVGMMAYRMGVKSAMYYVIARTFFLIGVMLYGLQLNGLIPTTIITANGMLLGSGIEAVVLAIALANIINDYRKQAATAQAEALRKAQENEQLVREQNVLLDKKIAERTRELAALNATLQQKNGELEQLNAEKNEIMGIVSHDLQNPIGMMRGLGELIAVNVHEPEIIAGSTQKIIQTSDRMLELVRQLLEINQLDTGILRLSLVTIDVVSIVEASCRHFASRAAAKNITVHLDTEGSPYLAIADEHALTHVVDNLLSNAVKYSPQGRNVVVRLKDSHSSLAIGHWSGDKASDSNTSDATHEPNDKWQMTNDRFVRIEVADEGPGISEEDMKKLFGKFARLSARPTGGEHSTGLGLSIVKKMVEAMNGRVWCESELGKGATFIVELPKADDNNL